MPRLDQSEPSPRRPSAVGEKTCTDCGTKYLSASSTCPRCGSTYSKAATGEFIRKVDDNDLMK